MLTSLEMLFSAFEALEVGPKPYTFPQENYMELGYVVYE